MMKKSIKRALGTVSLASMMLLGGVSAAYAGTVYYKRTPVSWDHGRFLGVVSYSDVMSGHFDHRATANTTNSGWQRPGVRAYASQKISPWTTARAYWDCRG
ncbi:hypothetical protein P8A24_08535 [Arcanobacterium wilhelmae]|uniref:hypothetical protein n=1 Tax=Arcanobacterium wilhelmae TaxID=1803177 RepID=UPI00241505B2|nr:hypothetical protein [Arcanobacterium wilhelmae]WFN90217.1 hypothetical protein P8A24_08535 [Arcanobacterium wilhelmae]